MRYALLLLLPAVLLGGDANQPAGFAEIAGKSEPKRFIAVGDSRVHIDKTGWYVSTVGGLRFREIASAPKFEGVGLGAPASFFAGSEPRAWIRRARTYAQIHEKGVYPGIDVVYHASSEGFVEYDFLVEPRANPKRISFEWTGSGHPTLDAYGALVLATAPDKMKLAQPLAYQMIGGQRVTVACQYKLSGTRVGFEIGAYDRSRPLVIDPVLVFARLTLRVDALATDSSGNFYTAGSASLTSGAYQSPSTVTLAISKRDSDGSVVWTAGLGVTVAGSPVSIAVGGAELFALTIRATKPETSMWPGQHTATAFPRHPGC